MQSIIIFASGAGSNAAAIIDYLKANPIARVALIVCNRAEAGVLNIAEREGIPSLLISKAELDTDEFVQKLVAESPALIVLAGFLLKIPERMVQVFPDKIINLHPALLPLFGGKGMYGAKVHQAVLEAGHTESGITVHYVNEVYDEGTILLQARCKVETEDTADTLAQRIHKLEHFYLPRLIDYLLDTNCKDKSNM